MILIIGYLRAHDLKPFQNIPSCLQRPGPLGVPSPQLLIISAGEIVMRRCADLVLANRRPMTAASLAAEGPLRHHERMRQVLLVSRRALRHAPPARLPTGVRTEGPRHPRRTFNRLAALAAPNPQGRFALGPPGGPLRQRSSLRRSPETPAGPRPDAARVGPAHPVRCYDFF